ncbi:MAG: FAD-dependent monooxygenase [Ignavibacteria bacterium]
MKKQIELVLQPDKIQDRDYIIQVASRQLKLNREEVKAVIELRRSIDARGSKPHFKLLVEVYLNEMPLEIHPVIHYRPVKSSRKVLIIGCGPAGMYAALKLIENGIKPVIIERGKDVQQRRRDLKLIQQFHQVNPDSNYCFGEGGAGAYSDGKLYTRSTKRGDIKRILSIFVQHGAVSDILVDAHPHIGSNKLPRIIQSMRETIISNGGEIHFNSRLTDFIITDKVIRGVIVNDQTEFSGDAVILATGHSARDIYQLCLRKGVLTEAKPYAMGVRIEHPQAIIDEIQYHGPRGKFLPAASYNLVCQIRDRGVFSFCMCPGGIIIPASTAQGELVLNGMSVSGRDSKFANSGFVVSIGESDWKKYSGLGSLAGLELQKEVEKTAFEAGGKTQRAPAQRVTDFVNGITSSTLPESSYIPGIISSPLHSILPKNIVQGLIAALIVFGKKMKGYYTEEAQLLAAETRTSSPVRIPRDKESLMHLEIKGLFPAGEGAGYAGGIVSAAIDGENCADAVMKYFVQ